MRVGIVTCRVLPEPDPDAGPLEAALRGRGHTPVMAPWDDPEAGPPDVDIFALRSAWNYLEDAPRFLRWCETASARAPFVNPPRVLHANHDKAYLLELEGRGLPIVPTCRFDVHERVALPALLRRTGWEEIVVKPAVSAGSFMTKRFTAAEVVAAQSFFDGIASGRAALVQRFVPGFDDPGERSLVWIDGEWTHAVRKLPRFSGEEERVVPHGEVSDGERALGDAAIDPVRADIVYARVDLVPDGGEVLISEVELMEPSLFFAHSDRALARYVDALERVAGV